MNQRKPIVYVSHDSEDGMWQFHDGSDVEMDDAMVVSLKSMVDLDSTIAELHDLPLGWIAWRNAKDGAWQRQPDKS
jgi:hypothetical protein